MVEKICARTRETDADLIIMTSHGRTGFSRAWLGSIADAILRQSSTPVLMLRARKARKSHVHAKNIFERILLPLDGSAVAMGVLPAAFDLARSAGSKLVLLRIVEPVPLSVPEASDPFLIQVPPMDESATSHLKNEAVQEISDIAASLKGFGEVESHVIVSSRVAKAIVDFATANKIDAIAMSTHGRGMSRLLIGSVADKILRSTTLPVLLQRPIPASVESGLVSAEELSRQLPALSYA